MKSLVRLFGLIAGVFWIVTVAYGAGGPQQSPTQNGNSNTSNYTSINQVKPVVDNMTYNYPSEKAISDLDHMRQEEKLAHDVYTTLYEKWGLKIFSNIASSESTHMAMVKLLLDKYNLPDPVEEAGYDVGVFSDQNMTDLYNQLVSTGGESIVDALKVGATIEDLDIADLQKAIQDSDNNSDIVFVYENLMQGSRNHLRAFVSTLEQYGGTYTPQYISQDEYEAIINTPTETHGIQPYSSMQYAKDPTNGKYVRVMAKNSFKIQTTMKTAEQAMSGNDINTQNMPVDMKIKKVIETKITLIQGQDNATITIANLYVPQNTVFYKYVKATNSWINLNECSSCNFTETTNSDGTLNVSFAITDGGMLDSDGIKNGIIIDPVVVGYDTTLPINTDNNTSQTTNGGSGNSPGMGLTSSVEQVAATVNAMPYQSLSDEEKNYIEHMREEEKLARDVYKTLYDKWGLNIFNNISQSEQTHMDMVKTLITKYNLPDPVAETGDQIGVFSSDNLQNLYNQLVEQGSQSLVDALKVGATIEDLDIYDLQNALKETDNEDISYVFNNLMQGSRNHMRAFVSTLEKYGETYTPQYITQEEYESIISSPEENNPIMPNSSMQYVQDPTNGKYTHIMVQNAEQIKTDMKTITQAIADSDIDNTNAPLGIKLDKVVNIQVTLPQEQNNATITIANLTVPDNAVFFKYIKASNTWVDLSKCDSCNFTETKNPDGTVNIAFTITDGGALDSDGTVNGIIVDPVVIGSELTSPTPDTTESSSGGGGGCTAGTTSGIGLLLLLITALAFSAKKYILS